MSNVSMIMSESDERVGRTALKLQARSRAVGVMVMAVFASLWAIVGARLSGGGLVATACMVAAGMAFALGLRLLRDNPPSTAPLPPALAQRRRRSGRVFLWTSVAEGLGIFLAVNGVVNLGHPQWQFAAVMAVVGLHFLPLALAFGYRPHLVTGVLLTAWALAYPWLFAAGALAAAGPFGASLLLIGSAAWALRSARGAWVQR